MCSKYNSWGSVKIIYLKHGKMMYWQNVGKKGMENMSKSSDCNADIL